MNIHYRIDLNSFQIAQIQQKMQADAYKAIQEITTEK